METLSVWPDTPEKLAKARARFDRFHDLAARYKGDASLRARLDGGGASASLAEFGIDLPDGVDARVVVDTPETMHLVLPPDPNTELVDETLGISAGGKTAGSAGTILTAGTFGCSCSPSTVSSAGSAGCAGSREL